MVCMTGSIASDLPGIGVAQPPSMTQSPPATRDEVALLLGEVDDSYIERVLDIGASVDEISEAIGDLEAGPTVPQHLPSTARVAEVREVLKELIESASGSPTVPVAAGAMGR